ncbi:hypothetical protein [Streptomyces malaysiensis]|uniref:hypothetical protein n=1 Tax=Streptomyces malaysiensis TaxID=92644 RepID=UPI0033ED766E
MSDDQLAAAKGSRLLDDRACARIEAEADRRDLDDLLARYFPAGTSPRTSRTWATTPSSGA